MKATRRTLLRAAAALAAARCAAPALAQADYPGRPIRLVVPFAPAGGTDITARALGQKLHEAWGQPVVVENRAGANGTIAIDAVAKSAPDGYTLGMISSSHSVNVTLQPRHPYDLERDLVPITQATTQPYVLVVNPNVNARTLQELLALARQNPARLTYGSSGLGGFSHLAGALLGSLGKVHLQHIPYRGGSPAMNDVISGQIDLLFSTILQSHGHINGGKLRPIAVTTRARAPALPETPTMEQAGLPGYVMAGWYGVVAPRGTPAPIVEKLNREMVKILQLPQTRERLAADGSEPVGNSPAEFGEHIRAEVARWRKLIQELGIKAE
ncbi:MAG TPA: tripartite tricarboxylate transporter substrate binding protein [Ramlibacter sp.]|nr:tripartite tricarboxylate transporter substrate binding protein [Ramlibacter sp.]